MNDNMMKTCDDNAQRIAHFPLNRIWLGRKMNTFSLKQEMNDDLMCPEECTHSS